MTWVKLDDNFSEHPKLASLPNDAARWFHVRAMCYAARFRTLGEITPAAFKQLGGRKPLADALVDAGLWDTTDRGGWVIHDFEVYNPSGTERRSATPSPELSEKRREAAQARWSRRHVHANADASAMQIAKQNAHANDANFAKQIASPRAGAAAPEYPSRPVPLDTPTGVSSDDPPPLPLAVTEVRDMVMAALPGKYQRDDLTWQEAEQFGRDFAGRQRETGQAIEQFRRSESGLPFPQKLRRYMPGGGTKADQPKPDLPPTLAELDEMFSNRPLGGNRRGGS